MKVFEIANGTKSEFIIEKVGEVNEIVFDSRCDSYHEYKEWEFDPVQMIEPESDGGSRYLHLWI